MCICFERYIVYWFCLLQVKGRTLPVETICLQSSSFATGSDSSWSREVVRDASISSVSLVDKCLVMPLCFSFYNLSDMTYETLKLNANSACSDGGHSCYLPSATTSLQPHQLFCLSLRNGCSIYSPTWSILLLDPTEYLGRLLPSPLCRTGRRACFNL